MLGPALAVAVRAVGRRKVKSASRFRRWKGHASVACLVEGVDRCFGMTGDGCADFRRGDIARVEVCRSARGPQIASDGAVVMV